MKILYAIQGTGNGHLSRAKEIIPALMNRARVDILVSGTQSDIVLPYDVKYRLKGISFVFGKEGGINYYQTLKINNIFRIIKEIRQCKVKDYDLIINDFEPISAWASRLRRNVYCISLSHQSALISKHSPKPKKKSFIGSFILKHYAPTLVKYSFHFKSYEKRIFTPVIRKKIKAQSIKEKKYYVVYLPAYSDEIIINVLSKLSKKLKWKVFSKHSKEVFQKSNIQIKPVGSGDFEKNMAWSKGVICGAGFETPAEALYLKKKLLVVPMKGQYEQAYNAESLKDIGVTVIPEFNTNQLFEIQNWIKNPQNINLDFPDKTQFIIDELISNHIIATELTNDLLHQL